MVKLIPGMVAAACVSIAACDDKPDNIYLFDATVIEKQYDQGSVEPLVVKLGVSMNGGAPRTIECRIKNGLRPLWDGLHPGKPVRLSKISSFDYQETAICGILNKAKVRDILAQ